MKHIKSVVTAIIILLLIVFYFVQCTPIPQGGELINSVESPNKAYTINAYLHENSLSSDAVRCEVVNNVNDKSRNIYWDYPRSSAEIYWTGEESVNINGVELNIKTDIYDFRWH